MRFLLVELAPTVCSSWLSASCRLDTLGLYFFLFIKSTMTDMGS